MATVTTNHESTSEVAILARLLGNNQGRLPPAMARYLLAVEFGDQDRSRMHDLAIRNQGDGLSAAEKEELLGYAKAGTVLSILKSRARRALRLKSKQATTT